ncbi:MAG: phosphoribosylglycinamide formyltransferase [Clostridiales bacterium]|uniref:phosphoribosylglycinamide formyltransferase n=1 Tax=Clostridia TaxID=186801 RepID=UPI0025F95C9E|nr:phosphoribosylglycinamide formyltransferase [uncultured Intestinibacter sp.]MDU1202913.1 phosphoribosylglycinamide formyltransferase [Clostridiales bacterium]
MLNIGVLISGGGSNLQAIIDDCESKKINGNIKVVISNREDAFGLERAKKHNIRSVFEKDEDEVIKILKEENIDLVVLAGYLKIISPKFVSEFENKIMNIHPALIPSFCGDGFYGEKVHQAVIDYGAKVSGATVHFVNEKADAGPIIMQDTVKVMDDDDAKTLAKRVLEVEHTILPRCVKLFCEGKISVEGRRVRIK